MQKLPPFILLLCALPAISQTQRPTPPPVHIEANTNDDIGRPFVYALKQELSKSHVLQYSSTKTGGLELDVATESENVNRGDKQSSAIAVVLVVRNDNPFPYYINSWIVHTKRGYEEGGARQVVANVSEYLDTVLQALQEFRK